MRRISLWWLVPLLLVTFWLGARGLNMDALWGDEYFSLLDAGGPLSGPFTPMQVWEQVSTRNPWHAPGYFILLNQWAALVGWEPPALRLLALLFGLLAVAWTYRLGRDTISQQAGVFGAAVLGTSGFFVHFLHELRMYTLVALLTVFTAWVYSQIMRRRGQVPAAWWLGLLVGALGLLYTHYFAALMLGAVGIVHALWAVVRLRQAQSDAEWTGFWRRWWRVAGVLALAGVLFVPWLPTLLRGLEKAEDYDFINARALSAGQILYEVVYLSSNGAAPLLLLAGLLAGWAAWQTRSAGTARLWLFTLALLALIIIGNALTEIILRPRIRYLISLFPLIGLLVGVGIACLLAQRRRWAQRLAYGLLAAWLLVGVWNSVQLGVTASLDGTAYTFPMHLARTDLIPYRQSGDVVVNYLSDYLSAWMYGGIDYYYYHDLGVTSTLVENKNNADDQQDDRDELIGSLADTPRVWVVYAPTPRPATLDAFTDALAQDYALCGAVDDARGVRLELYTRLPACCDPRLNPKPALTTYGERVALADAAPLPDVANEHLAVTLGWLHTGDVSPNTYSVALHLVDAAGSLVAQADYGLPETTFACQQTMLDLTNVAPGSYTLKAGVYVWQTGERLSAPASDASDALVSLGTIDVNPSAE